MGKVVTEHDVATFAKGNRIILDEGDSISPAAMDVADKSGIEIFQIQRVTTPKQQEVVERAIETLDEKARTIERIVMTIVGEDSVGIIASIARICADCGVNIVDNSQTILDNLFAMIMIGDIKGIRVSFATFKEQVDAYAKESGLTITIQHENLFTSMHRV